MHIRRLAHIEKDSRRELSPEHTFFALDGDQTLGREESRGGRFLDRRDYCKLDRVSLAASVQHHHISCNRGVAALLAAE